MPKTKAVCVILSVLFVQQAFAADTLLEEFQTPPVSAQPRVWWHWMNGNVTKQGIRLDLEWMKRVGIGGLQNFDAALATPQVVENRLAYMTPEWQDAFRYAADLAQEKGLELAIATSAGWSETGGPWVTPEQAMKKLVWSETDVSGGQRFSGELRQPPSIAGPFQDAPLTAGIEGPPRPAPDFYRDIAVIAYELPSSATPATSAMAREAGALPRAAIGPAARKFGAQDSGAWYMTAQASEARDGVTSESATHVAAASAKRAAAVGLGLERVISTGLTTRVGARTVDAGLLSDSALGTGVAITAGSGADSCVSFDYAEPTRVTSLRLALPIATDFFHSPRAVPVLESSTDGKSFAKVTEVPAGNLIQHTISFPAVTAKYFRVCFAPPPSPFTDLFGAAAPGVNMGGPLGPPGGEAPPPLEVLELQLFSQARVHRFEEKAGFAFVPDYYAIPTPQVDAADATPKARVIDLTASMRPDGTLKWKAPRGNWRIVRFGYSLTGKTNHPATEEATGLEVDKLNRAHVKTYLDTYLARYEKMLGPTRLGAQGVRALLVDSIEVGAQNWTEQLPQEFKRRRGYDLTPWMPALTGAIIGSAAESDKFLYDFRRTIAELLSDSHYAQIADSAKSRGLTHYGEALEQGRPVLGDDMEMRRHTNIPMAALWTFKPEQGATPVRYADIRGAASVAHIYGQNLVAAESLTSAFAPWNFAPRDLKPMIDLEFVLGVNRPVIHTSVHQPLVNKAPGLTLAIFGQYFNRNESWAEQASAWVSYLSRTSHLLQQGHFAADVLYFYGEEAPLTALYGNTITPDAPTAHGFDFANTDVLLNRVKAQGGALVTDTGMRYRLLWLGGSSSRMTLPTLKRIAELVEQGATVAGPLPTESPGLADDPREFQRIVATLRSRISSDADANAALARLGITKDFEFRSLKPDTDVMFLHRHLEDGEIYFLTNRKDREERIDAWFRVTGRSGEIWRATDGKQEPLSFQMDDERTHLSLPFAPYESYFVVFRNRIAGKHLTMPGVPWLTVADLSKEWSLTFQPGRGAPTEPRTTQMGSWTNDPDARVRYFSGTATYKRTFNIPPAVRNRRGALMLDLGDVKEMAEVIVNGRSLGILWHPPYRLNVHDALRAGQNTIELRVTNLWVNRLIGDAQPGASAVTFTVSPPYRADAPLRPSGLLGPVTLLQADSPAAD